MTGSGCMTYLPMGSRALRVAGCSPSARPSCLADLPSKGRICLFNEPSGVTLAMLQPASRGEEQTSRCGQPEVIGEAWCWPRVARRPLATRRSRL